MGNKDIIQDIFFNEILKEAQTGEIKVILKEKYSDEEYVFNVGFNTYLDDTLSFSNSFDYKPVLIINNKEKLIDLMEEYVYLCDQNSNIFSNYDLKTRIKCYLASLFANALYEDFANPTLFIKKYIDFYQNKLCDNDLFVYNNFDDSKIIIEDKKQDIRMETPYVFKISFNKDKEIYKLPKISYGISNNICYIYAVQNEKNEISSSYQKKIKRLLYKLNDNVSELETEEYRDYKNGDNYYPENISDVSPSALLSLSIFFDVLKNKGIEKVNVVSLLPIRYNSRELAFKKKYEYKLKNNTLSDAELKKYY